MPTLETTYLGLTLDHPIVAGASPMSDTLESAKRLEDAGAAAVVLRSLYEEQLRTESVATLESMAGPAESYSEALSYLPEPDDFVLGPHEYLDHLARVKESLSIPVIASLNGTVPGPWLDYAPMMEQAGADALELNLYEVVIDPNETGEAVEARATEIVSDIRARTKLPLAVKLSPFYSSLPNVAKNLRDAGAQGLILFNRFFEPDVDPENIDVVPRMELSSPSELLLRLRWLAVISGTIDIDLAVTGGVHTEFDAVKAIMCGAHAVQVVSAPLKFGPARITSLRDALSDWLDSHEYTSVQQMRGSMNIKRCPDPNAHTRAQYVRLLQTWKP